MQSFVVQNYLFCGTKLETRSGTELFCGTKLFRGVLWYKILGFWGTKLLPYLGFVVQNSLFSLFLVSAYIAK